MDLKFSREDELTTGTVEDDDKIIGRKKRKKVIALLSFQTLLGDES